MILCCGEAVIDMIPVNSEAALPVFAPRTGGSVFTTAIALGRLGADVGYCSALSSDLFGDMLRRSLAASDVDDRWCVTVDHSTTLAFVALDAGQPRYAFFDQNSVGQFFTKQHLPQVTSTISAIHCGDIGLVRESAGPVYERLLRRAAPDCVISLDPNIRPALIEDEGSYRARLERLIALSDILKLSDEDLAWFGNATMDEMVRPWLASGPQLIVITRGSKGIVAYSANHRIAIAAERGSVADTVGAGDTVNAALLDALHRKGALRKSALSQLAADDIADVLRFACRAAAVTVGRPGADPPWRHELSE
ncbi:carbohydrate kinase family protein [Pseudohoeflea coraliihabitans]|uniref:Carbohydrate kinase n=1 Tax=Pseudohoeflea coraliihabitans TaxID=2860393 RepID=A0ABS6WPE3_9HYPH|nr:carbohydrate kinase [Pseudohoeflea sp. DP4N28-3]